MRALQDEGHLLQTWEVLDQIEALARGRRLHRIMDAINEERRHVSRDLAVIERQHALHN